MTAAWPSTIPQGPIYGGFTEVRQRNVASFSPDVGPPKMRRRSTAVGVNTQATFQFSDTDLATFNTFFETTLVDGTLPFTWTHPVTAVSYTWMFAPDQAPQIEILDFNQHQVTCKLVRLP